MTRHALATRFVALVIALTTLFALALTTVQILIQRRTLTLAAQEQLTAVAHLSADRVINRLEHMAADAALIAGTAQVRRLLDELARAAAGSAGMPPARDRVEQVLKGYLSIRPAYTQARLIGLRNGGRELIRVDAGASGPTAAPVHALQDKGHEPYMRHLVDGPRSDGAPSGYFSDITLNREHGQVAPGAPPTIRYVLPLAGPDGSVLAAVVLNADVTTLLAETVSDLPPQDSLTIVTGTEGYVRFSSDPAEPQFLLPEDTGWTPLGADMAGAPAGFAIGPDRARSVVTRSFPAADGTHLLRVIATKPRAALFAPLTRDLRDAVIVAVLAIIITGALASIIARRMVRPLTSLARQISAHSGDLQRIHLDRSHVREIDDIARIFELLVNRLVDQAEHAQTVWQRCNEGLLTTDASGRILHANPALEATFGYPLGSLAGQTLDQLLPERGRGRHGAYLQGMDEDIAREMARGRVVHGLHRDGHELPLAIHINRFSTRDGPCYLGVVTDITEARAQQAELQAAVKSLKRSNAELDQFAYVASHDLRAPLRVIANASRWIEDDLGDSLVGDTKEAVRLLRNRVQRMDRLLSDLLEHSRIGRVDEDTSLVSVAEILSDIRDLVDRREGFVIDNGPGLEDIEVPRMPATKILLNLIGNAVKHHDKDTGRVRLEAWPEGDGVTFTVSDDGPGIPEALQKRAFGLFQTLRPRDQVEGSGMGLALVEKAAAVAGGTVQLTSRGRGCVFTVHLPTPESPASEQRLSA